MYKPPQNNNRVRSLRNKFENLEKNKSETAQNGCGNNLTKTPKKEILKEIPTLQRQTSDPLKNNIKRTPAFRVDKSVAENCGFQRNCFDKSGILESKLRLYTTIKNNCDNWMKNGNNSDDGNEVTSNSLTESLIKCENSYDSVSHCQEDDFINNDTEKNSHVHPKSKNVFEKNISYLYTEPIPKALRNRNLIDKNFIEKDSEIHNISTLKLSDAVDQKNENNVSPQFLTDTLRTALKKPLPLGPAPQKPPRTFQHSQSNCDKKKNLSFVPLTTNGERVNLRTKSKQKKTDAKYMLNKLENALKNNKLYVKKQYKTDISTTSGEDSDDSLLFKSKSNKVNIKHPGNVNDNVNSPTFNFNCLSLMNCSRSEYEMINQPGSSFFVDTPEQPIYVEPYHYLKNDDADLKSDRKSM